MNARKEINKMLDAIDNEHSRDRRNWIKMYEGAVETGSFNPVDSSMRGLEQEKISQLSIDIIEQQKAYNRQTHQLQQAEKKIANLTYEFNRVCGERDSLKEDLRRDIKP